MSVKNLDLWVEGFIIEIADKRGEEAYFNDQYVRGYIDGKSQEEAWIALAPTEKLFKIHDVFKVLSRKGYLTPQKRAKGSPFYAKRSAKESGSS
jgi:hypothetical protein